MAIARNRMQCQDQLIASEELDLLRRMWLATMGAPMPEFLHIQQPALDAIAVMLLRVRAGPQERCGREPLLKLPPGMRLIYLTL